MNHDIRKMVSEADVVYDKPAASPVEGSPIGNGRMGTMVWTTPDAIQFQINRVDVFAVNRNSAGSHFPGVTDYGGSCARITIGVGGEPWRAGSAFRQSLSLQEARCNVAGEGVSAACWVAAEDDVLVVTLTDEREAPQPINVTLSMSRDPKVVNGAHIAAYTFRENVKGMAVVQNFCEADHYCSSAVAVWTSETAAKVSTTSEQAWTLRLPAMCGARGILIASAASWDEHNDAGVMAQRVLDAVAAPHALQAMAARSAHWWQSFWQRTFVEIKSPDGSGERAARGRTLFLYHMAATSRGAYPPKWNGSIFLTDGDARCWGAQYWLWTTEMLYWPLHAADAGDLCEPFFEMYRRQVPALEAAARQRWNAAGIFLPETAPFDGPVELPSDLAPEYRDIFLNGRSNTNISARLVEKCKCEWHLATLVYQMGQAHNGYSWISHVSSSAAELAVHAWWRYRFTGDVAWLRSHAYPLLRGVAEFYRSYCRKGDDGRWHIHGTNAHEDFWGVTDSIMDLAAIRGTVPLAIRAAEILGVDAELRQQWRVFLAQLALYPMGNDPRAKALKGAALADDAWAAGFKGAVDGSHNSEDVQLTPIFPFEDWTMETRDPRMAAVAHRTLATVPRHRSVLAGASLNTAIRSPIAAVRAGRGEDLPVILDRYRNAFTPLANGFSLFEQTVKGYQAHSIEHLGLLTMTLQESLLQSVAPRPGEPEIISVFPAWPRAWDAEFCLLARGGFLVSASCIAGKTDFVEIHSRRGETCRFRNCWGAPCMLAESGGQAQKLGGEILTFSTKPGKTYRMEVCR